MKHISTKIPEIKKFLRANNIDANIQEETGQIILEYQTENKSYPLFIRFIEESHLLQFILVLYGSYSEKQKSSVARLLHAINRDIDYPGFGMDENTKTIFYRIVIPTPSDTIESSLVLQFLKLVESILSLFTPLIGSIARSAISYDELLEKYKNSK